MTLGNSWGKVCTVLVRVYVCGRTCIESGARLFSESTFPGRQGRLAWTYLVCERHRAVPRAELLEAIWGDDLPAACDRALSALLSKIRALFAQIGVAGCRVDTIGGGVRLALPAGVWVDLETAYADMERADRLRRTNDLRSAYGWALATYMIASQELLPAEERPWLVRKRSQIAALVMRAIDALAEIYDATGNTEMALQFCEEAIARDPLHEIAYRRLIALHAAAANNAGVASSYQRCLRALDGLGCRPSNATEDAYRRALTGAP